MRRNVTCFDRPLFRTVGIEAVERTGGHIILGDDRMHPCLESHGVVVNEIVERESMEYNLGGNTILWFSMVLFR